MKKLLFFSLICMSFTALTMQSGNEAPQRIDLGFANVRVREIIRTKSGQEAIELITPLLMGAINLNGQDSLGRTAIWLAALEAKNDIYNLLLENGANPDIKSTAGDWAHFSARELREINPEDVEEMRSGGKLKLP